MDELLYPKSTAVCKTEAARNLIKSFESTGLAYLHFDGESTTGYREILGPAFEEAQKFFDRPLSEKLEATERNLPLGVTRGYLGTGVESGAETEEWKEAFSWSYNHTSERYNAQNCFQAFNVWPDKGDEMKKSFDQLYKYMLEMMLAICDALVDVVDVNLRTLCVGGESISLLRAFHYHAYDEKRPATTGSCAHTDWGLATLVAQQVGSQAALQACIDGVWHDIAPKEDTLVINCSDFLSLVSNGQLKSPVHRVILTEQERLSFVYFQYPAFETAMPEIGNVRNLSLLKNQADGEREFLPNGQVSFGEFIASKWAQVSRS